MQDIKIAQTELFEHDENEKLIGEVPRHPIGIYTRITTAVLLLILLSGFGFVLTRTNLNGDPLRAVNPELSLVDFVPWVVVLLGVLIAIGTAVSIYVYRNNYLVLTDQKLVFIRMNSLFSRTISQLSIGDVQDATIEQNGMLSRLFDFGSIKVETAGEMDNFSFHFADDPIYTAKCIVDAHEENLKLYGN